MCPATEGRRSFRFVTIRIDGKNFDVFKTDLIRMLSPNQGAADLSRASRRVRPAAPQRGSCLRRPVDWGLACVTFSEIVRPFAPAPSCEPSSDPEPQS